MDFALSDEQVLLSDGARRFAEQTFDYDARRKATAAGFDRGRWQQLAGLGWTALAIPEAHGGLGGSAIDHAVLIESLGAAMLLEPLVPVAAAARLLAAAGATALLPATAEGIARPVIAHNEARSGGLANWVETSATRSGAGWSLSGRKTLVLGGDGATHFIVSARTSGAPGAAEGISLFLVPADAAGLASTTRRLTDDSLAAELAMDGLALPAEALVGAAGEGLAALVEGLAWLQLGLHAEALGIMDKALAITRDYVGTRKQFGAALGTFQAVQHRIADMACEAELCRSILFRLLAVFDAGGAERDRILAAAKVQFGKGGFFVGSQAVQLHGGMGMTDEYVVGMMFKRLVLLRDLHGGLNGALNRLARDQRRQAREMA